MPKKQILEEIFYILTLALVILTAFELVWPRAVLAYLNLGWGLLVWFVLGIVISVLRKNKL